MTAAPGFMNELVAIRTLGVQKARVAVQGLSLSTATFIQRATVEATRRIHVALNKGGAWLLITGLWRDAGLWVDVAAWRD